tara:strand:- start:161 stop:829 length:669 start_codon:yes stop_codon:yes gene_type:complete
MIVEEVAALFRRYMDEPDQTFVDDAQMAIWLSLAYNDFRSIANSTDPYIFTASSTFTLTNARTQTLAGTILGAAAPAAARMYELRDIWWIDPATPGYSSGRLRPGSTLEELVDGRCDYVLVGDSLTFNIERNGTIVVNYIPEQNVDWAAGIVVGSNEYIDDLNSFHDLIALTAYLQYAIVDSADNAQLLALFGRRQRQLVEYLESRGGGLVEYVSDVAFDLE